MSFFRYKRYEFDQSISRYINPKNMFKIMKIFSVTVKKTVDVYDIYLATDLYTTSYDGIYLIK